MRSILENKKGQTDIITFIGVAVALLFLAPIMLKIVNESVGRFSTEINKTQPSASVAVDVVHNSFTSFWDYVITIAFFLFIVTLLITSFLVNTHPIFLIIYIITVMLVMMFSPYVVAPIEQIFGMDDFSTEVAQLPLTTFVLTKFNIILLSIIILSGIIMYAKYRGRGSDL